MQLAEVGHARVGGERGLAIDERLKRAVGGAVAAQLHVRVHQHRVGVGGQGSGAMGGQPVAQTGPEVMARQGQGAQPGERLDVVRVAVQAGAQGLLGAGIEGGVAGLAHPLDVGQPEGGVARGGRGGPDGGLEGGDPGLGGGAGHQRSPAGLDRRRAPRVGRAGQQAERQQARGEGQDHGDGGEAKPRGEAHRALRARGGAPGGAPPRSRPVRTGSPPGCPGAWARPA